MSRQILAFALLAVAGAATLPDDATAAGFRGGFRGPAFHGPVLRALPRPVLRGHTAIPRNIPQARRGFIPPAAQGFGTLKADRPYGTVRSATGAYGAIKPLHPFAGLTRRHHRIHHAGWSFPSTFEGFAAPYIGTPYDPAEAIPVYGPAPADTDPATASADPAPRGIPTARIVGPAEENRDACRAEKVTVPSSEGEREITLVRC